MTGMLETPSRVWRRIQDTEGQDMPSLPSLPAFEDSGEPETEDTDESEGENFLNHSAPLQSTPAAHSMHKTASTIRPPSSTSSTARFARSVISRSSKSSLNSIRTNSPRQRNSPPDHSLDISDIPSQSEEVNFADIHSSDQEVEEDAHSLPELYLPSGVLDEDELDISEALAPVSRSNSPLPGVQPAPKKKYDYSVSLKSEPRASPFDKLRNVSFRRPLSRPPSRIRTPSLTHTLSPDTSLSNSSPHSTQSFKYPRSQDASPLSAFSVPLPRSATTSPTAGFPALQQPNDSIGSQSVELERSQQDMSMATEPDRNDPHRNELDLPLSEQGKSYTDDEREPTFSSDDGLRSSRDCSGQDGTPGSRHSLIPSPGQLANAFSSPAPSITFTPTPAFQPRPRARFTALPPSTTSQDVPNEELQSSDEVQLEWRSEHDDHEQEQEADLVTRTPIPATPYAHKRSFLLSVINSTARPRMKFLPTPHPHKIANDTPSTEGEDAENQEPTTPGTVLRPTYAPSGMTPRPQGAVRRRISQPFPNAWERRVDSAAARLDSGHDPLDDRASVISTTSSQDLTTHARANASFDPVIGLGERGGHGVGRFNAGKLNSYLHGLNRKLQEENEALVDQLRAFEDKFGVMERREGSNLDKAQHVSPSTSQQDAGKRISGGGRRVSAGPLGLNDVVEEAAEIWDEEKAELEEVIDGLKEALVRTSEAKEEAERMLEDERGERARDKERWRDRMGEVEKGVEGIVRELENKHLEAEQRAKSLEGEKVLAVKGLERQLLEVVSERDMLVERVEQAEAALCGGKEIDAELNAANERVGKVMNELKTANLQIQDLEHDLCRRGNQVDTLEKEIREEKRRTFRLQQELDLNKDTISQNLERITALESELADAHDELAKTKRFLGQLEKEGNDAVQRVEELQEELSRVEAEAEALNEDLGHERERASQLEGKVERVEELVKQLEEALQAAENKTQTDQEQIVTLQVRIGSLERDLDKAQPTHHGMDDDAQVDIDSLENELTNANREIARLTTLLAQSPARKAIEKVKDSRIELLEKEKEDLQERVRAMKNNTLVALNTPHKLATVSGITPMHKQILAMSFKSPKTPGGPLKDLSWLQTTMNDPTTAPLFAEIERLQDELDRANNSIDEKLDRLEDAGVGVVQLTNHLEDAKATILALENTLGHVSRREERRLRRLDKLRCQKCHIKVDVKNLASNIGDESSVLEASTMSLPMEPPTPPTKTSEKLRLDLQAVNRRLVAMQQQWENERCQLTGQNAILQDTTKRLTAEVRSTKFELQRLEETEKVGQEGRVALQRNLDKAKCVVDDLEAELKSERSHLRELMTEQAQVERQKEKVALQLRRTESDMNDVKEQLLKMKHENHTLEVELRANCDVEQKARRLESKVAENSDMIEQLRQERSLLATDHRKLQKRYADASDHISKLREKHATSQTSHDNRRHQLDLQALELQELRIALTHQTTELRLASEETARMKSEKLGVVRTVETLETDLRRVKRDADVFGRDLRTLREQRDKLMKDKEEAEAKTERIQKQTLAQIRILKEELHAQSVKHVDAEDTWYRRAREIDHGQLTALRAQHKNECKGLIVQIRYLKAKFTRESTMRSNLSYQKQYLLTLLARSERTEHKILAVIATIGYPPSEIPMPMPTKRTLKSVVIIVMFLSRARRASAAWKEQCSSKEAIAAALQDIRRRRATVKTGEAVVGGSRDSYD